jgi:hypothetical protein
MNRQELCVRGGILARDGLVAGRSDGVTFPHDHGRDRHLLAGGGASCGFERRMHPSLVLMAGHHNSHLAIP